MTENKKTSVLGIYRDHASVERGTDVLIHAGFDASAISILIPESLGPNVLTTQKNTKAPEGTATGASTGAVIGGTLGLLIGIGALAIPGLGPFIAAGPLMATLAGVGVGGAIGGFAGALVGAGIPEYEAKLYERRLQRGGGVLIAVHCDTSEQVRRAKDLLAGTGAEDISASGETSAGATTMEKRAASGGKVN